MDGAEVVQVYVSNKTTSQTVPITALKGFKRVDLKKGEVQSVSFTLNPDDFAVTTADALQVVEPGTFEIAVGGKVPDQNSVVSTLQLVGKTVSIP